MGSPPMLPLQSTTQHSWLVTPSASRISACQSTSARVSFT